MKKSLIVHAIVLAVCTSSALYADTIFNFSFQSVRTKGLPGVPFGGLGQLDTQETNVPGTFLVKGITGTTYGEKILGLQPSTVDSYLFVKNGVVSLNGSGVRYLLSYGSGSFSAGDLSSVLGINTGYIATLDLHGGPEGLINENAAISLSITANPASTAVTPEPNTFVLLATGGLGLIGRTFSSRARLLRRSKNPQAS